jgi:hypothetical protein
VGAEVAHKGTTHPIPQEATPVIAETIERCFRANPKDRPDVAELATVMSEYLKQLK